MVNDWHAIDLGSDPDEVRFAGDPAELLALDDVLAEILHRPAWHADAACREHPELSWFPGRGDDVTAAKTVCASCLVAEECARYAIGQDTTLTGIWGGSSERARRNLRRSLDAAA